MVLYIYWKKQRIFVIQLLLELFHQLLMILVLKLTIVSNIWSPKWLRNSARISRAIFVLMSYMLARTLTLTCWLHLLHRMVSVSSCLLSPCRAK